MSLGSQIDNLVILRAEYRKKKKEADDAYAIFQQASTEVMEEMENKQNVMKASGLKGTASIIKTVVAHVKEWDKVYNYILRHKEFHLMQRRISDGAYREILEKRKGKLLPGIETFEKKGISLREIN